MSGEGPKGRGVSSPCRRRRGLRSPQTQEAATMCRRGRPSHVPRGRALTCMNSCLPAICRAESARTTRKTQLPSSASASARPLCAATAVQIRPTKVNTVRATSTCTGAKEAPCQEKRQSVAGLREGGLLEGGDLAGLEALELGPVEGEDSCGRLPPCALGLEGSAVDVARHGA